MGGFVSEVYIKECQETPLLFALYIPVLYKTMMSNFVDVKKVKLYIRYFIILIDLILSHETAIQKMPKLHIVSIRRIILIYSY